jgi:lycopene beta-cyclase
VNHAQYLLVMAACVVCTLPLEFVLGARVWRRPGRLVKALVGPVIVFVAWDIAAIAHHQWRFNPKYVTGIRLPGSLPIEELLFFIVVPICALLTFEVVSRLLGDKKRGRDKE